MSLEKPDTLDEWHDYIFLMDSDTVYESSNAANSLAFVEVLQEENYSSEDICQILTWFAEKLQEEGMVVPKRGNFYLSYADLLEPVPEL